MKFCNYLKFDKFFWQNKFYITVCKVQIILCESFYFEKYILNINNYKVLMVVL